MVIHEALLTALQLQVAGPLTVTAPVPPAAAIVWADADNVNEQGAPGPGCAGRAACEIVTT